MSNQKNLYSPFEGEIIPLQDVKDPIFSEKTMGDGYAVGPTGETIYAPVSGIVRMVQGHAAGFSTADDLQVFVTEMLRFSRARFEALWGDYPLVMQKYDILYDLLTNEFGVEL